MLLSRDLEYEADPYPSPVTVFHFLFVLTLTFSDHTTCKGRCVFASSSNEIRPEKLPLDRMCYTTRDRREVVEEENVDLHSPGHVALGLTS